MCVLVNLFCMSNNGSSRGSACLLRFHKHTQVHHGGNSMKVYQVQPGAGLDGLSIDERPEPTPAPRQVLIKVKAVSLNDRDLLILKGFYPGVTKPVVPVSDGMGEVVALGEGVTRVKVGDRVIGTFFQRWIDGPTSLAKRDVALGGTYDGLLAEYALLDAEGLVLAPDHLSDEEASCLPCAGVTAWRGATGGAGVFPGETGLLPGTGGLGSRGWCRPPHCKERPYPRLYRWQPGRVRGYEPGHHSE